MCDAIVENCSTGIRIVYYRPGLTGSRLARVEQCSLSTTITVAIHSIFRG